jgi:ribosomal protein S18 acetylase RimI-like enzyme
MNNFKDTIIKVAQEIDYPQMLKLLNELAKHENTTSQLTLSKLKKCLQNTNPKLEILVAKNDDVVIGCALFYRGFDVLSASYGSHISDIIVQENARNNGVGKKLMQAISNHTINQGGQWLSWTVDKRNEMAKNFYLSHGGEVINVDFMAMGITNMKILLRKS